MSVLIAKVVETLVLVPGALIILALAGLICLGRQRRLGVGLILSALVLLTAFSTPVVAKHLMRSLERYPPLAMDVPASGAGAIVLLGGGFYAGAPEYGGRDTVSGPILERMRYAVHLHKATGLPILVTGGTVVGDSTPESVVVGRVLREDFGVRPRWLEPRSRTTWENAAFSQTILAAAGIDHVFLVTHAWHMPRAVGVFERAGLKVTPAPTIFTTFTDRDATVLGYLPSAGALANSQKALHEYLGRLWYWIRGASSEGSV